jgi:HAD superfamily hydrolase (TIGR01484 family)
MQPLDQFPRSDRQKIRFVLTDIDDTLTVGGKLPAVVFSAMEALQRKGIRVVPITGRPAGWCDHIARMWPVDGLVGENGAFYFRYDVEQRRMVRRYWKNAARRQKDRARLEKVKKHILAEVPGCRVSADQAYREADLAIDFCEDVPPLPRSAIDRIVELFEKAGARAKVSSIHVNGWFGDYDKLTMTRLLFEEVFAIDSGILQQYGLFVGDSPNDCPMFAWFPHAVGVANILNFRDSLSSEPAWVTAAEGGYGFAEMVKILLS